MFGVDLDHVAETAAEMARCHAALGALLEEIGRDVGLLHETWTGAAAGAQLAAQEAWEAGFRQMRSGLATMRGAAVVAEDSYRAAVDTNLRMWEQVS